MAPRLNLRYIISSNVNLDKQVKHECHRRTRSS